MFIIMLILICFRTVREVVKDHDTCATCGSFWFIRLYQFKIWRNESLDSFNGECDYIWKYFLQVNGIIESDI